MSNHKDLSSLIVRREPTAKPERKMISVSMDTYEAISDLAESLNTSRTATVDALVKYYESFE